MFIWVLLKLGLDWEQAARRSFEDSLKKGDQMLHRTLLPVSGQFTGGEQKQHRSDQTLNNVPPASGVKMALRSIKRRRGCQDRSDSILRPVKGNRTRSVVTCGVLDLSVVDRTPGGSVRSLPPVRPVS